MKRFYVVIATIMALLVVGCGSSKAAGALGVPAVKDGVTRSGDDCIEVYFEWDKVEGAEGYEVSVESKYYSEEEYRDPETVETTETSYVAGAQDDFDFRIKVRAYKGAGADRTYGEWSSFATGSAKEAE